MDIIDLVLTVCLIANPNQCRTEHLYFENRGSVMACMFLAPSYIAKWSQERPGFKVVRWKCEYPDQGKDI